MNRWRSVCSPTVEFAAQPSSIVQIVGACIRFRQKAKLPRGDNIGKSLLDPDQQPQSSFPSHQRRLQSTKPSVRTCFSATHAHRLTSPISARTRGVPYPSARATSPQREHLPLRKGGPSGPIPPWVKGCRVKSTTLLLRISSRSALTTSQLRGGCEVREPTIMPFNSFTSSFSTRNVISTRPSLLCIFSFSTISAFITRRFVPAA